MARSFTVEQFRTNVQDLDLGSLKRLKGILDDQLRSITPEHPERLFYTLTTFSQQAFELGMIEWRQGNDPTHWFNHIKDAVDEVLNFRIDVLPGEQSPGFLAIVSSVMGWTLPFNTDAPTKNEPQTEMTWIDRWVAAGLADRSCWALKDGVQGPKNRFVNQCLHDYWALLTSQISPMEGIRRCIANYDRRATNATFKNYATYMGGGNYNDIYIDYPLAAIMKKMGLKSGSVHDWVWS